MTSHRSSATPPSLVLREVPHPARPPARIHFFGNWDTACEHVRDHILSEPECLAWALVMPAVDNLLDLDDPDIRWKWVRSGFDTSGAAIQGLYDLYAKATEFDLQDAARLRWFAGSRDGRTTVAMGTSGVLAVISPHVLTAFLPGQGSAEATRHAAETGEDSPRHAQLRQAGMRSGRADRFGPDDAARERRAREQRESTWTHEKKLHYRVFRPAVQFVRQRYHPEYDLMGRAGRRDYGLLKDVLPAMSQLRFDAWLALRVPREEKGP